MTKITEEMIETAFGIYFTKKQDIQLLLDLGMNENSAKMTIVWFDKLFNGQLNKRSASTMQIKWILNKLYETGDYSRLKLTLDSLNKYCEFYDKKPMVIVRNLLKEFEKKLINIA